MVTSHYLGLYSSLECTSDNDRERRSVLLSSVAEEVQHLKEVVGHLEEKVSDLPLE